MRQTLRRLTPKQWAIFILGMALSAVVTIFLVAVIVSATKSTQIRDTQETNTEKSDARDEVLDRIRNCTTPGRPCYDRGQRQLAKAVGDVNRVVILAAACASKPFEQSVEAIQACVVDGLATKR
jgi:hypothetical protein